MVDITAQGILDRNNWTESQISLTNLEYLIDDVIDWVNLMTGASISAMTGVAGSKTVTVSRNENATLKMLLPLIVRAYLDRGPSSSAGGLSVAVIATDPQTGQLRPMVRQALQMLRGRSFERV